MHPVTDTGKKKKLNFTPSGMRILNQTNFMFRLTSKEFLDLRSQTVISSWRIPLTRNIEL